MDQDKTWHEGRPQPRPHCVRWGPSTYPLPPKGAQPPFFRTMCIVAKRFPISATAEHLLILLLHYHRHAENTQCIVHRGNQTLRKVALS